MRNTIAYSILKYSHSKFLGEELNLGILFVFPELEIVEFYSPKSLNRLNKTYPDISEKLIRSYLASFKQSSKNLSKSLKLYKHDLNQLIYDQLIVKDSSSLQFTSFSYALFSENIDQVKDKYINLYLRFYDADKKITTKRTDKNIIFEVKELVKNKNPKINSLLKEDHTLLKEDHISLKTDFYWQNGTTNYVKAVSLDYEKEESIIEKSLLIDNQLKHLKKQITERNSRIDLLVAPPSNSDFNGAYEQALSILLEEKNGYRLIYNNNEFIDYADKIINEIELNPKD